MSYPALPNFNFVSLRFTLTAQTRLALDGYTAGHLLRGALGDQILRATCPENPRKQTPTPQHAAVCPACWLLASNADPGEVRRAYAIMPPLPILQTATPEQQFTFHLKLFGEGIRFLPYFVLAVPAMGQIGIGRGRGKFTLHSIDAPNPFDGSVQPVLAPGSNLVYPPTPLSAEAGTRAAQRLTQTFESSNTLLIQFHTPTRLINSEKLVKTPDFAIFFRRLIERIDQLAQQYAAAPPRPKHEIETLHAIADHVRLVDASKIRWVDLFGKSGRTGNKEPLGGFVGTAKYHAKNWDALLPFLLLGAQTQVGKYATRGHGCFSFVFE